MHAFGIGSFQRRMLVCSLALPFAAAVAGQAPERGPLVLSITAITNASAPNPVVGHVPFFSRQLKAMTSFFRGGPTSSGSAPQEQLADVTSMVTWSSSNPNVIAVDVAGAATLGPDANGCAPSCTVNITATYGRLHALLPFTIYAPTTITILDISTSQPSPLPNGEFQVFVAYADYADSFNCAAPAPPTPPPPSGCYATKFVQWNSSDTAVLNMNNGVVQALMPSGSSTVSCTLPGTPAIPCSNSPVVTVGPAVLSFVFVTPHNQKVAKGNTLTFTANGHYTDKSVHALPFGSDTVSWSFAPADGSIATVNSSGVATGVADGIALITATPNSANKCPGTNCVAGLDVGLTGITVSPASLTIPKGATMAFTANGAFSDSVQRDVSQSVNWLSSDLTVAKVDTSGNATTVGQPSSTATISAATGGAACPGTFCGQGTVNVGPPALVSIAVAPTTPTLPFGSVQQFTATGTYSDGSTQPLTGSVTWTPSDNSKLCFTSCPVTLAAGQAIAESASGSVTVMASFMGVNSPLDTVSFAKAAIASIKVTPKNPSVPSGAKQQFTAKGTYTDRTVCTFNCAGDASHSAASVTWRSTNLQAATIISSGLATATGSNGSSTIEAMSGSVVGSTTMTVTPAALKSIDVEPASISIGASTTQQYIATGTFTDGTMQNLTAGVNWNSDNTAIATISNSSGSEGLATGVTAGGPANITATDPLTGIVSNKAALTVKARALQSIAVTPNASSVAAGLMVQLTAMGTYNAPPSPVDMTGSVQWSSSNTAVASVNSSGLVTGVTHSNTAVTITATDRATSTVGSTPLTVNPPALESISVAPAFAPVALGNTLQYNATGNYSDGSTADLTELVTWSTASGGTITSIDNTGLLTAVALSQDSDTVIATCSASCPGWSASVAPGNATVSVAF